MRCTLKIKVLKMWVYIALKASLLLKLSKRSRVVEFF
jgi:hypothetical protein